jgi:dTDP-glucose 4,6-dehydratase
MRVLVTGGCGFIGSHFVKRLASGGDEVVVLDKLTYSGNPANIEGVDCELVEGDIADPDAVARAGSGCRAVVNFAAESHVDRSILEAGDFIRTDVYGTHVLLEWARGTGARFLQVSTDEVYGDVPMGASSREDDPLRPSSAFVTKSGISFSGY